MSISCHGCCMCIRSARLYSVCLCTVTFLSMTDTYVVYTYLRNSKNATSIRLPSAISPHSLLPLCFSLSPFFSFHCLILSLPLPSLPSLTPSLPPSPSLSLPPSPPLPPSLPPLLSQSPYSLVIRDSDLDDACQSLELFLESYWAATRSVTLTPSPLTHHH